MYIGYNPCMSNPCNNGRCVTTNTTTSVGTMGGFRCECPLDLMGERCHSNEKTVNHKTPMPCLKMTFSSSKIQLHRDAASLPERRQLRDRERHRLVQMRT